jgi:CubicO group peptidase (beta-lactamase class C family)
MDSSVGADRMRQHTSSRSTNSRRGTRPTMAGVTDTTNRAGLADHVTTLAGELGIPGVAVGIVHGDDEQTAFHGITSVPNPLPVTEDTLFQFGSITKTYTATALVILAEHGKVDLGAPVRRYVPELTLADEDVARTVTVAQLLNHTSGWDGDLETDTGDGDDALARFVAKLADLQQQRPLGSAMSYSNTAFSLAGRVIEHVTGHSYETAIGKLIFTPLGQHDSYLRAADVMTRRFVVGHLQGEGGELRVARPWHLARNSNPAGGIVSTLADQLTWARFHLGDGTSSAGTSSAGTSSAETPVLSADAVAAMREPTVEVAGGGPGEAVGTSWFLRTVDGVLLAGHGGTTAGQFSELLIVPEHRFAIVSATNSGPNGLQFNQEIVRWALDTYLGVIERDPEPVDLSATELARYTGEFETAATVAHVAVVDGGLVLHMELKPETKAELGDAVPDYPPFPLGILPGQGDEYVITGGPAKGLRGYFVLEPDGAVSAVDLSGRVHARRP